MPTYDYQCQDCGHQFEARQSMKDPHLTECPECKGHVKRKVGLGSGFIFKGTGFYITDYRSESYKAAAKADSAGAGGGSSSGSAAASSSGGSGGSSAPAASSSTGSSSSGGGS